MASRLRRNSHPKPVSGVIGRLISSLGISRNYNGWTVVANWPEIVGEEIARRAKAIRFQDGTLYIAVAESAWRQELAMQAESLLREIQSYPYGGAIKQIRLVRG